MIQLFSLGGLLRFFAFFLIAGGCIVLSISGLAGHPVAFPHTGLEAVRFISFSLTAGTGLVIVLGHHTVVDGLWRMIPLLGRVVPNLNGDYELQTSSNWPLKQQMLKALDGQPPEQIPDGRLDELQVFQGVLRIQLGFLRLKMTYEPSEKMPSRSSSEVVSSTVRKNPDSDRFELCYVFKGRVVEPKQTDEQVYFGAAELTVHCERGRVKKIEGTYWTNRSWRKGLNTAGIAKAFRKF